MGVQEVEASVQANETGEGLSVKSNPRSIGQWWVDTVDCRLGVNVRLMS